MSVLRDALGAIKSIILIEERMTIYSERLARLAEHVAALDRRVVRIETVLDLSVGRRSLPGKRED
jgi:hypothetical protein